MAEKGYFPDFTNRPRNGTTGKLLPDNRKKKRPSTSPCWESLRLLRPEHPHGKHTHICIHPTAGGVECGHTLCLKHDSNVYIASTAASTHHKTHSSLTAEIKDSKRKRTSNDSAQASASSVVGSQLHVTNLDKSSDKASRKTSKVTTPTATTANVTGYTKSSDSDKRKACANQLEIVKHAELNQDLEHFQELPDQFGGVKQKRNHDSAKASSSVLESQIRLGKRSDKDKRTGVNKTNISTASRTVDTHHKPRSSSNDCSKLARKRTIDHATSPESPSSVPVKQVHTKDKIDEAAVDPYEFSDENPQPSPTIARAKKRSKKTKTPSGGIKNNDQPTSSSSTAMDTDSTPKSNSSGSMVKDTSLVAKSQSSLAEDPLRTKFFKDLKQVLSERDIAIDYETELGKTGNAWFCGEWRDDGKTKKQPMDVFEIRQQIARIGLTELNNRITSKQAKPECTGMEGWNVFRHLKFSQPTLKVKINELLKLGCDNLPDTYTGYKYSSTKVKNVDTLYKEIIAPYEEEYQFQPIKLGDPSNYVTASEQTSIPGAEVTLDVARKFMTSTLLSFAEILEKLKGLNQTKRGTVELDALLGHVRNITHSPQEPDVENNLMPAMSVAILGATRSGKSYTINTMLKVTEVSDDLYGSRCNDDPWRNDETPTAEHAAKVVARFLFEDLKTMLSDDTAEPTASISSVNKDCFDSILNCVLTDFSEPKARNGRNTLFVNQCSFGEDNRNIGTERVVWELPSGPGVSGEPPIFKKDGTLNAMFSKGYYTKMKDIRSKISTKLQRFVTNTLDVDLGKTGLDGEFVDDGEFVLPCESSPKPVTRQNFFITGGEQYALVVRFVSSSWLDAAISDIKLCENPAAVKKRKERILHILFRLENGGTPPPEDESVYVDGDPDDDKAFKWWEDYKDGKVNMPRESEELFDKIFIYQGAGMHTLDDRLYLHERQDKLLASKLKGLIHQIHWVVPSSLFDYDSSSMIVDTPGLGDMDVVRQVLTEDAILKATGIMVFAPAALSTQKEPLAMLNTLGVTKEIVHRRLGENDGATSKDIIFLINTEKDKKGEERPRATGKNCVSKNASWKKDAEDLKSYEDGETPLTQTVMTLAESSGGAIEGAKLPFGIGEEFWGKKNLIRQHISTPTIQSDLFQICPALLRGIMESPKLKTDDKLLNQTGMVDVLLRVKDMLCDPLTISSTQAGLLLGHITTIPQLTLNTTQQLVSIPAPLRTAAETLRYLTKSTKWRVNELATQVRMCVQDSLQESPEWLDEVDVWVNNTFNELKKSLPRMMHRDCFEFLKTANGAGEEHWDMQFGSVAKTILSAKTNQFLYDQARNNNVNDKMSCDAYGQCRGPFNSDCTWILFGGMMSTLGDSLRKVIIKHICALLMSTNGVDSMDASEIEKLVGDVMQQHPRHLNWDFKTSSYKNILETKMRPIMPRGSTDAQFFLKSTAAIRPILRTLFAELFADFPEHLLKRPTAAQREERAKLLEAQLQQCFTRELDENREAAIKAEMKRAARRLQKQLKKECLKNSRKYSKTVKSVVTSIIDQPNVASNVDGTDIQPEFKEIVTQFEDALNKLKAAERNDVFFGKFSNK